MITRAVMMFPCGGTVVKSAGKGAGYFKAHKLNGSRPTSIRYEGYGFTQDDKEQVFKRSRYILHPNYHHVYLNCRRVAVHCTN